MLPSRSRVLHVFASLDRGGAESMVMSLYRNIDRKDLQFDFVVNDSNREYAYEQEIQTLGGRVFRIPDLNVKNIKKYQRSWTELLNSHPEWNIAHIHHTSTATVSIPLLKKAGLKTIAHSHTAGSDGSFKARLKILSRYPVRYLADYLFACSNPSARWMFGYNSKKALVLNNAIDVQGFLPDTSIRAHVRNTVDVTTEHKVIGHVGRFVEVKNHTFMLDVLKEMVKKDPKVVLMLVGDGPLKEGTLDKAKKLGVFDNVVFAGIRSDISDLMQAMDAFIFPSLHEGLPVTLVEAQASGLPCLVSDTVSNDVQLTSCVEFLSLAASTTCWADRLLEMCEQGKRPDNKYELSAAGYDVKDNAIWLETFYNSIMEKL